MAEIKPSKIICKKCGYQPNVLTDVCIKCGGEVVKICGNCGYENRVEKMYCDNCGSLLALTPEKKIEVEKGNTSENTVKEEKKIAIEFEPITETMSRDDSYHHIPKSDFKKDDKNDPLIDKAKKIEIEKNVIEGYLKKKEDENIKTQNPSITEDHTNKKRVIIVILSSLLLSFILSYFFFIRRSISRYSLLFTAKKYLTALKNKDYEKAYSYLSSNSRMVIPFVDYVRLSEDYYSAIGEWDFKDIKIYYFSNDRSIVSYKLKEKGVWRDDYLNFIKEHNLWRRPYIWTLLEEIDRAAKENDMSKALFLSQKLFLIDPIDPRSSYYLCWSEYFMKLFDKSAETCKRAIEISSIHPIKYYNSEELFWLRFNYADSLRFIGRNEEAIKIFNELINLDVVPLKDKCVIFITRADAYVENKSYDKALSDLVSASAVCKDNLNKREVEERSKMLKGEMKERAIDFLKRSNSINPQPGYETMEDYLNFQVNDLNKKSKKARYSLNFKARHLDGPLYEVIAEIVVKNSPVKSYKAIVDLWKKEIDIKEEK